MAAIFPIAVLAQQVSSSPFHWHILTCYQLPSTAVISLLFCGTGITNMFNTWNYTTTLLYHTSDLHSKTMAGSCNSMCWAIVSQLKAGQYH